MTIEEAFAKLYEIEQACPDLVVKVLTVKDVQQACDGVDVPDAAKIRQTDGWRRWHEHNDLDHEEVFQIAFDAYRK